MEIIKHDAQKILHLHRNDYLSKQIVIVNSELLKKKDTEIIKHNDKK